MRTHYCQHAGDPIKRPTIDEVSQCFETPDDREDSDDEYLKCFDDVAEHVKMNPSTSSPVCIVSRSNFRTCPVIRKK